MKTDLGKRVLSAVIALGAAALMAGASPVRAEGPYGGQVQSRLDAREMYGAMERVNVNTASMDELAMLPGIGHNLARAIVSYRDANGRFESVDQLLNVNGIGKAEVDSIRDRVTVW